MARHQYSPPGKSHEKRETRKERKVRRKELLEKQEAARVPTEEIAPTEEDKVQLKNLGWYATIGILAILALMYYLFAWT
ncbi:MAG: hypothetical protein MK212_19145 [Saprospiraceae bacterium]|nr:hypothetical protein [Saprospiraceae bacterium]